MKKDDLFYAFRQGIAQTDEDTGGNCTSVALIKAAIDAFGLDNVFIASPTANGYDINLKNGAKLEVSNQELKQAAAGSGFVLCEDIADAEEQTLYERILSYAHLCFTVIIKQAQLHGEPFNGTERTVYKNFSEAMYGVNDGLSAPSCYYFLGLEKHAQPMGWLSSTHGINAIVSWSAHHTVYVCDGFYDQRGRKAKMRPKYASRFRIIP